MTSAVLLITIKELHQYKAALNNFHISYKVKKKPFILLNVDSSETKTDHSMS